MNTMEIIAAVESIGGHLIANGSELEVKAPKGSLSPELVATLKERKPDLLEYLRLVESCHRIEEMQLAIKVTEKAGERSCWLVASTARSEVNDDAPVTCLQPGDSFGHGVKLTWRRTGHVAEGGYGLTERIAAMR